MKQFLLYFGATISFGVVVVAGFMFLNGTGSQPPIDFNDIDPASVKTNSPSTQPPKESPKKLSSESPQPAPVISTRVTAPVKRAKKVASLESVPLPVLTAVSGKATRSILSHNNDRQVVRWFPKSDRILVLLKSEMRPSKVVVVDVQSSKPLWNVESKIELRNAAVSADGSQVAIAEKGGLVTVYDAVSGKVTQKIPGPQQVGGTENVADIRFSESGKHILTVHYDRTVRTWDIASKQELSRTSIADVATYPTGFVGRYVRCPQQEKVQWWDVQDSAKKMVYEIDRRLSRFAEMSGDGRLLAIHQDGQVTINNVNDGSLYKTLEVPLRNAPSTLFSAPLNAPQRPVMLLGGSFSSNGKRFAAFSAQSRYLIWDIESGEILMNEKAGRDYIHSGYSSRLSPDGQHCLLPTDEGGFAVVDIESGDVNQLTPGVPVVDWRATQATGLSQDGQSQAVALVGGSIEVRDTETGKVVWSSASLTDVTRPIKGRLQDFTTGDISAFAVSNGGALVVATTHSGEVFVVSREQPQMPVYTAFSTGEAVAVELSPNNRYAVIATTDGQIIHVDMDATLQSQAIESKTLATIDVELLQCSALAIDSTSSTIALGLAGGTVEVRSLDTFSLQQSLPGGDGRVSSLAFSDDGRQVGCTTAPGTVFVWDVVDGATPKTKTPWPDGVQFTAPQWKKTKHARGPRGPVRFSHDGTQLFVGSVEAIDILSVNNGEITEKLDFPASQLQDLALRRSDNHWLASREFGEVYEWAPTVRESLVVNTGSKCRFVQFTPNGKTMIAGGEKGQLSFIDATSGEILHTGKTQTGGALAGAVSPDGTKLAVCGYGSGAEVWDIPSRKSLGKYYGHQARIHAVAFSPDSKLFASGSEDGTVRVRVVATKQQTQKFEGHALPPATLAFSRDGKRLLSGTKNWKQLDKNGILRVWDLATGKMLKSISEPFGHVIGVGLSPFDQSISVAVANTLLTLEDNATARVKDQFSVELGLSYPRYLLHGRLLAFMEYPSTIHVRDVLTGDELTKFSTRSMIFELAAWPHGNAIAAACEDGTVHVWRLGE